MAWPAQGDRRKAERGDITEEEGVALEVQCPWTPDPVLSGQSSPGDPWVENRQAQVMVVDERDLASWDSVCSFLRTGAGGLRQRCKTPGAVSLSLCYLSHLEGRIRRWEVGERERSSSTENGWKEEAIPTLVLKLSKLLCFWTWPLATLLFLWRSLTKFYAELSIEFLYLSNWGVGLESHLLRVTNWHPTTPCRSVLINLNLNITRWSL